MSAESRASGRVAGLQRSGGGVPKLPVDRVQVNLAGIEGDWQRDRRHHGGPDRALCLYSVDLIERLLAEGHPIFPGAIGENVTVGGIDWRLMIAGVRLTVGPVAIELTEFAVPCSTIAAAFIDRRIARVGEKANPGWSRIYARVLRAGSIAVGDPVAITSSP